MDAVVSCFGTRKEEDVNNHLQFIKLLIDKMKNKVYPIFIQGVKRLISFFSHGAFKDKNGSHVYQKEEYVDK